MYFQVHVVWGYVSVIQSQNMLVCLDRFLAIFCPFWYKDTMTPALAYLGSFVAVVVVTAPWTLFIIMGWLTHPVFVKGVCYLEISQNYWRGIKIFIGMSILLPGSISVVLTAAVFYHRKLGSSTNREFPQETKCPVFQKTEVVNHEIILQQTSPLQFHCPRRFQQRILFHATAISLRYRLSN